MAGDIRHVLVIEDDLETAEQLVHYLSASGYSVDLAVDGEEGLRRGLSPDYLVMTVDRLLPRIDGIEIIRRLREQGVATPALILSALRTDAGLGTCSPPDRATSRSPAPRLVVGKTSRQTPRQRARRE